MTDKTKKIIAREGLVIIGLLMISILLSLFALFLESRGSALKGDLHLYTVEIDKMGTVEIPATDQKLLEQRVDLISANARKGKAQEFSNQKFHSEFINFNKGSNMLEASKWAFYLLLCILFLLYPIYLLTRFIIWAVRMLQKK